MFWELHNMVANLSDSASGECPRIEPHAFLEGGAKLGDLIDSGALKEIGNGNYDVVVITESIWAPKESHRQSLGAAQYTTTDGYGENRAGKSVGGLFQHRFGSGPVTFRAIGLVHAARANSAGVVRTDDIDDGSVCYHCAYDDPGARAGGEFCSTDDRAFCRLSWCCSRQRYNQVLSWSRLVYCSE